MDILNGRVMISLRVWMLVAALLGAAVFARPVAGQVFSPGELIRGHAELDSLRACHQCHSGETRLAPEKCLACHTTVGDQIKKRAGYHGAAERSTRCETCHPDHRGRNALATEWPSGKPETFGHQDTGWALEDAHAKLKCKECHDAQHVSDPAVRDYVVKNGKKATYLGLSRDCMSCHFDEHRGELGTDCASCHNQAKWRPAPTFDHAKSWLLAGAHDKTACDQCHPSKADAKFSPAAFPAPRAATYMTMKPVAHKACTDCHDDPHRNIFGHDCESCHTEKNWTGLTQPDKLAFHDKTRYRLEGRHRTARCAACHPANQQGAKLWRPIAHETCVACHPNAHPDLPAKGSAAVDDCADCHTVSGYLPVRYTTKEHETARYPLRGAHRSVACPDCHLKTMGAPLKAEVKTVAKFLAKLQVSPWRLREDHTGFETCGDCHADAHRNQFASRDCAECHDVNAWVPAPLFDHDKTEYKLDGEHRKVACRQCHGEQRDAKGQFVRYRPLPSSCESCHFDTHYGQFRLINPRLSCACCHDTVDFKKPTFSHQDPGFTDYPLKGGHTKVACKECHPKTRLSAGSAATDVVRYRPTASACELCHEDEHKGKYREANRLLRHDDTGATTAATSRDPSAGPSAWFGQLRETPTRCTNCHVESGWQSARFSHGATGYPLRGSHAAAECAGCHKDGAKDAPPRACASCHADPHRGALGTRCAECHNEADFRQPAMSLTRHAQTSFPLEGVHAVTPCAECHRDTLGRSFGSPPRACVACHKNAIPAASANVPSHAGFSPSCGQCHTPVDWRAAAYANHDRCFPIGRPTNHAGIACRDCHKGGVPAVTNTCSDSGVSCIACHGNQAAAHRQVNGYEPRDRKCYECHRGGT